MNLYELQKEINWKRIVLRNAIKNLEEIDKKMQSPKTSNVDGIIVQGGKRENIVDRLLERKMYLEDRVEIIKSELKDYEPLLNELESLLKEYNDLYQLIYFEYYIKGYSADKIGMRHGYSRRQVYNIINTIDEKLEFETLKKERQKA